MDITKNKWAADTGNKRENKRFSYHFLVHLNRLCLLRNKELNFPSFKNNSRLFFCSSGRFLLFLLTISDTIDKQLR